MDARHETAEAVDTLAPPVGVRSPAPPAVAELLSSLTAGGLALDRVGSPAQILALQRTSGNRAVNRIIASRPGPGLQRQAAPTADAGFQPSPAVRSAASSPVAGPMAREAAAGRVPPEAQQRMQQGEAGAVAPAAGPVGADAGSADSGGPVETAHDGETADAGQGAGAGSDASGAAGGDGGPGGGGTGAGATEGGAGGVSGPVDGGGGAVDGSRPAVVPDGGARDGGVPDLDVPDAGGGGGGPADRPVALWDPSLERYRNEKAVHEQWGESGGAAAGGMTSDQRWQLIRDSVGAGVGEGLLQTAGTMAVDTVLNQATRRVPYAAGFIAIGQIGVAAMSGPDGLATWFNQQGEATGGRIGAGVAALVSGHDAQGRQLSGWDKFEAFINILDGVNNILSLLSTICFILAALGLLLSFVVPAVIPFLPLLVEWGMTLGNLNSLIGIFITILRAILMAGRIHEIATSNADPAVQAQRAASLRHSTAQFTQEWTTRRLGRARQQRERQRTGAPEPEGPASALGRGANRVGMALTGGDIHAAGTGVSDSWARRGAVSRALGSADDTAGRTRAVAAVGGTLSDDMQRRGTQPAELRERQRQAAEALETARPGVASTSAEADAARSRAADAQRAHEVAQQRIEAEGGDGPAAVTRRQEALTAAEAHAAATADAARQARNEADARSSATRVWDDAIAAADDPGTQAALLQGKVEHIQRTGAAEQAALQAEFQATNAGIAVDRARAELGATRTAQVELESGRAGAAGQGSTAADQRRDAAQAAQAGATTDAAEADAAVAGDTVRARVGASWDARRAAGQAETPAQRVAWSGDRLERLPGGGSNMPAVGYGQQGTGGVVTGQGTGALLSDSWWLPNQWNALVTGAGDRLAGAGGGSAGVGGATEWVDPFIGNSADQTAAEDRREAWARRQRAETVEQRRVSQLPAPPSGSEEALAGSYEAWWRLKLQRDKAEDLAYEARAEAGATAAQDPVLAAGRAQAQMLGAESTSADAALEAHRDPQARALGAAEEQGTQADRLGAAHDSGGATASGPLTGIVRVLNMVPSDAVSDPQGGAAGAQRASTAIGDTGGVAGDARGDAGSRAEMVRAFASQTDAGQADARAATDDVCRAEASIADMQADNRAATEQMVDAGRRATDEGGSLEEQMAAQLQANRAAAAQLDGWAAGHGDQRTAIHAALSAGLSEQDAARSEGGDAAAVDAAGRSVDEAP